MSFVHRVWRTIPHGTRRWMFDRATAAVAPPRDPDPGGGPPWIVAGALRASTGLGEAARLAVAALEALGEEVAIVDLTEALRQPASVPLPPGVRSAGPGPGAILVFANPPVSSFALRSIPSSVLAGRRRVGCFVWELERTPENWARHASFFHEIAAPSRFAAAAIARSIGRKVRLLPHPAAASPIPTASLEERPFTIGFIGDTIASAARKNPQAVMEAFQRAGLPSGAARLELILHGPADAIGACGADVVVHSGRRPRDDARAFYAGFDLYLSLHRAEGFGLTVAEAMLAGVPAAATNWSATSEFLDVETGWPLPFRLTPSPPSVDDRRAHRWAEPDIEAACVAIREAFADPARRRARGAAARERMLRLFSAEQFRRDLIAPLWIVPQPHG